MDGDQPLVTDNGNHIIDAHTGPTLTDPAATEAALLALAGVVQVGLFIGMCDVVHLAGGLRSGAIGAAPVVAWLNLAVVIK